MEVATEVAAGAPALSEYEQLSVQPDVTAPFAPWLLLGPALLLELAWVSGIGYFVYWLLS